MTKTASFFSTPSRFSFSRGRSRPSRKYSRSLENDERWKRAEAAEFRLNDLSLAASLYQDLAAKAAAPALEAFLLNRLARCYAKSGKLDKAVDTYRHQLRIGVPDLASDGIPLETAALYQIGSIYLQKGQRTEAADAFLELYRVSWIRSGL